MYTYYIKVHSEEHMLYLKEIAKLYGIYTLNDVPNSKIVTAILQEYASIQKKIYPEIYWESRALMRVYPYEQYHPAMTWFLDLVSKTNITSYRFSNNKNYNFVIKNEKTTE